MKPQQLIDTEEEIRALWEAGELPYLTHLDASDDGSLEAFLCGYFKENVKPTDWVLASHRCHLVYQLHGGTDLIEKVKLGKSMFCYAERFICSAIVGGTCSIAVGLARSIKERGGTERVHCFMGDGCEDHGHYLESVRHAIGAELPIRFIILDNDSSCGVTKAQRGSPEFWPYDRGYVTKFHYNLKYGHAGTSVRPNLKWKPK